MFQSIRTFMASVALTTCLALPARAIAQDVVEIHLTVGIPVTGYPAVGQGFWKKYSISNAPAYKIISGTAPGLLVSPVDEAEATDEPTDAATDGEDGPGNDGDTDAATDGGIGPGQDGDTDAATDGGIGPGQDGWPTDDTDAADTDAATDGEDGPGNNGDTDAATDGGIGPGQDGWPTDEPTDGRTDEEADRGVSVAGTPEEVGVYSFEVDEVSESGTRRLTLNVYVFKDASTRDAVSYYANLALDAEGYDTYYWAALRGYFTGIGLNDESLAGYNYNASLALYFYASFIDEQPELAYYFYFVYESYAWYARYALTQPNEAAYRYFYNQAIAAYYLYYYQDDMLSAVYFFNLYMGYADSLL